MALDAYSPCPCGSGKKFKWCCQPIHVQIDKAFRQDAAGQHDAALRMMDEVLAEHPANPEAWGRKSQLLYQNGRAEEAEQTLQKALEINPNYPFGHLLRGMFRQNEGELQGALLLFRKAAELYDPEARDALGQIYASIAESELKLNRPVAGRAALTIALRCQPADEGLRQSFDALFGDGRTFPPSARREYKFAPPASSQTAHRQNWDRALQDSAQGKLTDAVRVFEEVTVADAADGPGWYNLALARAWVGNNLGAVEALDRYVALENDESKAAAAWSLAEVLRCGEGMQDQADYVEHAVMYQIRDAQQFSMLLQDWGNNKRLIVLQAKQEEGIVTGLLLEKVAALTPELAATQMPALAAHLVLIADHLRLGNTDANAIRRLQEEIRERAGPALSEARAEVLPANFQDILSEALTFPVHLTDKDDASRRVLENAQRYFEEKWIHRPLKSLNLIPPIDAAGHANLRKKLLGVVGFLEECAIGGLIEKYDFNRLRRKLGLLGNLIAGETAEARTGAKDIAGLGAAELATIAVDDLSDEQVEEAYRTATKLDAHELAGRFARTLIARPPRADRPDRYPWYAYLIQAALAEGDSDAALNLTNEGEKTDCEQNEGKRRNDYELRRAQVHSKRGETDEAQGVFERLIQRVPTELRYRGSAAEAMLSAKQPARALGFAEEGLKKAREQNDRDSEEYFKELVAAARRNVGA